MMFGSTKSLECWSKVVFFPKEVEDFGQNPLKFSVGFSSMTDLVLQALCCFRHSVGHGLLGSVLHQLGFHLRDMSKKWVNTKK